MVSLKVKSLLVHAYLFPAAGAAAIAMLHKQVASTNLRWPSFASKVLSRTGECIDLGLRKFGRRVPSGLSRLGIVVVGNVPGTGESNFVRLKIYISYCKQGYVLNQTNHCCKLE